MPYTLDSLPDHVKRLSTKKQRQWMHVYNSCAADGGDEGKCARMANGVAAKETTDLTTEDLVLIQEAKAYQYVETWDYEERKVPQAQAGYTPLGATNDKGCANCNWFVAPGRCAVVAGEVSPTGLSNLWMAKATYEPAPIPVTIVADNRETAPTEPAGQTAQNSRAGGFIKTIAKFLTGGAGGVTPERVAPSGRMATRESRPFTLARQKDGRLRFYAVWSNNFTDRDGEIFTHAAHKEFVAWADENKEYPELWIWHTAGSKFGQVDWLDCTDDGFVHASGLIDAGKEAIAEKLAEEETGVSHGFWGLQAANIVHWYRSYELSALPLQRAAVWTTSFNILNAGKAVEEMGFTPEKRKYFTDLGIDEATIKQWEDGTAGLGDALKAIGLESKAADLGLEVAPPPTPEQKAEADFRVETTKQLAALTELVGGLAAQIKEIKELRPEQTDAAVAAALTPQGTHTIVQASKASDNVVAKGSDAAQPSATNEFFNNTVLGPLLGSRTS